MEYKVISADNHILEPRDLFTTRLPKQFRDRAPHVERGADGGDGWTWNDKPPERTLGLEACAGLGIRISGYKWEEILPGNYDGAAHLADMQKDGVDAAVLFPTVPVHAYGMADKDFALALIQTFNDWLYEDFVAPDPNRLIGLAMLPVDHGIDTTLAEFDRCLAKGAKAFFIPTFPETAYVNPQYDALWSAAEQAGTPLCLHRTSGGKDPTGGFQFNVPGVNMAGTVTRFFSGVQPLTNMIYTGIFARHPKLKVMDAELNFGWIPFWSFLMDDIYTKQKSWAKFGTEELPSKTLGRNVFVTVLDDEVGFDLVGTYPYLADVALFSLDYPHSLCLWPNSADHIQRLTKDMDPAAKEKILAGNAVNVFNLN
jgi:predicted TIM-barrel fold metal-dependent hydrolase